MNILLAILFGIILILAVMFRDNSNENTKWLRNVCSNLDCKIECIGICGSDRCLGRIYYASIKRKERK